MRNEQDGRNERNRRGDAPGVDTGVDVRAVAARHAAATAARDGEQGRELSERERVAALVAVAGDVPRLLRELRKLRARLRAARLHAANLEAAGRATLAAQRDGEADPLWYLRDEIGDDHRDRAGDRPGGGPAGGGR